MVNKKLDKVKLIYLIILVLNYTCSHVTECFIPNKFVDSLARRLNGELDLEEASDTLTHGEITKRGIIKSIAKFMSEQKEDRSAAERVHLDRLSFYWTDIRYLYNDFYSKWISKLEIDNLIETSFRINVAMVDFDERLKDLPQAHFDANKFVESNERIIDYSKSIITAILRKDYVTARQLAAETLHTIQDFYSHSNWIEMGNRRINEEIGTNLFSIKLKEQRSNGASCVKNCTRISIECSPMLKDLISLFNLVIKCPVEYFKCHGNLVVKDRLVSGYYSGQKVPRLDDSCNHGGLLDTESMNGGINKDSGYYLFSPHADLHRIAADLAIEHTEYFFNQLRNLIGDNEFNYFLKIKLEKTFIDIIADFVYNLVNIISDFFGF